jgi:UDP-N-acetylmuramoylalanine--D-glutamate ligase
LESGTGLPSHDRDNALAAFTAIWALGVDPLQASTALMDFSALPHRCEVVANRGDVTWVNDSKATNPGAAQRAIEVTGAPIIWIAGGRDKGLSYSSLAEVARRSVKTALLIGEAAEQIERALDGQIACERCGDLETAVGRAAALSQPGDVVLLAPACASFDQFKNFEDRGESFRAAVRRHRGKNIS